MEAVLLKDKYLEVVNLSNKKNDLPDEPYKSKYEAREILNEMKGILTKIIDDSGDNRNPADVAKLASVFFLLGSLAMDVDEMSTGEECLYKALSVVGENEINKYNILCILSTLNQLGLLWSMREQDEKAFEYLRKSESLYKMYKVNTEIPPPSTKEIFSGEPCENASDALSFEKIHTLTLFYLAQVYKTRNELIKSAQYCHWTLRRQLETKDFDKIEWALNSATLSQFLLEKNAFKVSRHHLAAASFVLNLQQSELDEVVTGGEEHDANKETLLHRKSDVDRCWAKYGINLLNISRNRLMDGSCDLSREAFAIPEGLEELWFRGLNLEKYESQVPCDFILTFEDARPVFIFAQECLKRAKEYYTLDDMASDFISIQQDLSELYRLLAFFEDDEGRQCKMHKRRVDILTSLLTEISPVHYVQATRELYYELADTYSTIMDIKYDAVISSGSTSAIEKHNALCYQGIKAFKAFISTFCDRRTSKLPDTFPKEFEKCVLIAHISAARLYNKILTTDNQVALENHKNSYELYKQVVDYCVTNQEAKQLLQAEYTMCDEMVRLLPYKMSKMVAQM